MSRHRSRHRAVQILYQCDLRNLSPEESIRNYYGGLYSEEAEERPGNDGFMEELVRGVIARRSDIDRSIDEHSEHWRVQRMPAVDRNILRLAIYELMTGQLPAPVVIDEALELARRFGGRDTPAFINGVLDAIHRSLPSKPAQDASPEG
ncbi:MAG TPA: transcription antitermination factor NusB [Bryobacteraceae bacterium]|nr:transcription antitermination factor NusB [Bryobacteraceae bacterium]